MGSLRLRAALDDDAEVVTVDSAGLIPTYVPCSAPTLCSVTFFPTSLTFLLPFRSRSSLFPVTTIEGKRYAIFMRNQTLVVDKETETLLSVAVLLKAGFDVKFVTGTKEDPTFGGYLVA